MGHREIQVADDKPILLWVEEVGGYPDFSGVYRSLGYEVIKAQGVRKALAVLKTVEPQVVVAEFNYAPTYGARISPVEPLLARLQSHHPMTRVLLFAEPERIGHLEALQPRYGALTALSYPIQVGKLERFLEAAHRRTD
jgi:hypothetical protein